MAGTGPERRYRPGTSGATGAAGEPGLFDRVRRMLATLVTLAHTRLELVTVELEEEVQRLTRIVLWALVGLFCVALTVLLLAFTIVIAFWEDHRLLAALLVTATFAIGAVAAGLVVRRRLRERPRLLSATIGELQRDARALGGQE